MRIAPSVTVAAGHCGLVENTIPRMATFVRRWNGPRHQQQDGHHATTAGVHLFNRVLLAYRMHTRPDVVYQCAPLQSLHLGFPKVKHVVSNASTQSLHRLSPHQPHAPMTMHVSKHVSINPANECIATTQQHRLEQTGCVPPAILYLQDG